MRTRRSERSARHRLPGKFSHEPQHGGSTFCRTRLQHQVRAIDLDQLGQFDVVFFLGVLYHLREVLEAPIVFMVEGEKDVDKLREHGFAATTNAGGAKARWLPQYTEALRGREVYIIPDNDSPGWERARCRTSLAASSCSRAM